MKMVVNIYLDSQRIGGNWRKSWENWI